MCRVRLRRRGLRADPGAPEVWALDSISLIGPDDAGRILIAGSHRALAGGSADRFVAPGLPGLVMNDAGASVERIAGFALGRRVRPASL